MGTLQAYAITNFRGLCVFPPSLFLLSNFSVLPVLLTAPVFITANIKQCYTNYSKPYRYHT